MRLAHDLARISSDFVNCSLVEDPAEVMLVDPELPATGAGWTPDLPGLGRSWGRRAPAVPRAARSSE